MLHGRYANGHTRLRLKSGAEVVCRRAEFLGVVEVLLLDEYAPVMTLPHAPDVVIDVGANVGAATILFATGFPKCRVIAVEPAPDTVALLQRNVAGNGLSERVEIVAHAIADHDGDAWLTTEGPSVGRRILPDEETKEEVVRVSTMSLARLFDALDATVDVMVKLDCEGAEWEILESMSIVTLRRASAYTGEYHLVGRSSVAKLVAVFENAGFRCATWPHPREAVLGTFLACRIDAGIVD
jgi:FkbM family methyltransferase